MYFCINEVLCYVYRTDNFQEVQIFRAVILPEEDLGQVDIQTVCFVLRFAKNEFISSDAMSKLRQVNCLILVVLVLNKYT